MKNSFLFPALLFIPFLRFSQVLFVFYKAINTPVEAVTVFTEDQKHFEITDITGRVNIKLFPKVINIIFRHSLYKEIKLSRAELEEKNYKEARNLK